MNKITRSKSRDFTVISNVFLRDKDLSIKAKGFLAVVMGLPEDWDFSINGICQTLKEGKTAVYNVISELKEKGYCDVKVFRNEKGIILGNDYSFFEEPNHVNQYQEEPHAGNPNMDKKPQLNTKETKKEKEEINNEESSITWRESFELYKEKVNDAKNHLLHDYEFYNQMMKYYPNSNYSLTLDKMVDLFWGTEAGWNNKKKSKTKNIDMIATLKNNYGKNIVYRVKGQADIFVNPDDKDKLVINGVEYQ